MYQFESRVRYSETDSRGRLTPEGIMEYFEDCTTFHSEDVGLGVQFLKKQSRAWVLSFLQIEVNRYPSMGERIVIQTIPYEIKSFLGYRNFIMRTSGDEVLAYANSMWTYLDISAGKPVRASEAEIHAYGLSERYPMDYAPRKIALPERLKSVEEIVVKPHHLDTNNHVNNVEYVRMARELVQDEHGWNGASNSRNIQGAVAADVAQGMCGNRAFAAGEPFLCGIRVEYKQSALLGDAIYPAFAWDAGVSRMVVSLNDNSGKPYAVVELKYGKHDPVE